MFYRTDNERAGRILGLIFERVPYAKVSLRARKTDGYEFCFVNPAVRPTKKVCVFVSVGDLRTRKLSDSEFANYVVRQWAG